MLAIAGRAETTVCGASHRQQLNLDRMVDRPVVLAVKAVAEVAPLPPSVTLGQAKSFMTSVANGGDGGAQVMMETARQVLGSLRERL